jgi:histidine kinase
MSSVGSSFQELAKLNLSNLPLFGREQELSVLEAAWSRTLEGSSESVFVEGSIGSGKTALVTEFVRRLESSCPEDFDLGNRRIFFCSGKCEQAKPQEPYHALRQALTDLCEAILNSTAKDGICKRLRESIGADGYILAEAVPGLLAIVGDVSKGHSNKSESSEGNQTSSVERLKEQLKVFLRIVCSEDRKVILFLDDLQELQWSDKATIELLQYVINDSEIRNFMFVGAFSFTGKDKCNDEGNKQTKELMEAVRQSESAFSHINVENLGIEGLNEMLVYLLKLDSDHTRPLARIIHRKTLGDVSVALDFLQQLVQDKFLVYSLSTYQWEIKLEDIEAKTSVAEPVIDIISDRLFNFPFHIQQILMVGASLASKFDVPTLNLVLKEMPDDFSIPHTIEEELQLLLRLPVSEGLLDDLGGGSLKFSHERIREATYGLLPSGDERDQYHYKLGKILLRLRDNAKDGKQRFTLMAADQLNLGSKAIHKFEEKLELAEINLLAGKKAKSLSAFVPAWRYFNFGISMLGDESKSWQVHYNLSLALYTNAVEMASCLGYYEQSIPLADTVLKNAKSSRDKAPIYFAKVNLLGQNEKFEEAMDLSSKLLSQLGESLPSKPKKYHVMSALRKTEELMKGKTDEDILSLPIVTEARVITIMKLLNTYCVHSLFLQKTYSMLLSSLRMNLMTFKHGLTSSSPSALCFYAFVIANNGKVDEAVRIGRLAIKLVTTLKAHEWQANCINVHVSFVRHWREPYSVCMNHSLEGYKSGVRSSLADISSGISILLFVAAMVSPHFYSPFHVFARCIL